MKKYILLITLIVAGNLISAQNLDTFFSKTDAFLTKNVANGKVAYASINKDSSELDELLKIAEGIKISKTDANNYQAFWINAYNLSVIKGIVNDYPINSPLDKKGFFEKTKYNLGGKSITLNDIENKLLRAQFNDARVHFVLVCGAIGCPPLISEAYMPSTLNKQLDRQTKKAINGAFVKLNTKKKSVRVSQIMEWYKKDFVQNGTEIDFLNTYRTEKIPSDYKLSYFTYNWKLNKQ